ncbi:MAG: type II secretion system protein M [Candidatus Competibacteraceae bacterium]|nr:type II secretion system protein M [Candidatus Competibacteraceae bacterium]
MKTVSWGQRLAALLLLVLLLGGGLYLLAQRVWIDRYRYYQGHLEQQTNRLAQLERITASRDRIQQSITRIQQDRNAAAQYLPQSAPAVAAAELQQRVKSVVEAAGGTLRSTQVAPPAEESGAIKVAVSVSLTGDTESLQKILYELEAQTPLLFVDNLDVTARENRPRLASGRLANYSRIQLNVQLEISGYLRKGKA